MSNQEFTIEQIYTGCLAQGAYYLRSGDEAAIIDPLREVTPYLERAERDGVTIRYIFETHFHADFVSGHLTLAERTGAPIIYGPNANPSFAAHIAADGEEFPLGELTIRVLHTPGHTMESTTYLLLDPNGKEHAIFTGDTLFLGDVGRPDLAQKAADMTQEQLAGTLFDSLRERIIPLPDDLIVYPAHGAGSACGKKMMKQTVDTLGNQKRVNYALRADMTREEFIAEVTDGLEAPPAYFPLNVRMNREGYADVEEVLADGLVPLDPEEFEAKANDLDAVVLDVRTPDDYAAGHVPGSIFVGLDGSFAPWVGELIVDVQQPILLIAPDGREEEAITRLSRVGFDRTLGYLGGGIEAWRRSGREVDTVATTTAETLAENADSVHPQPVFDVRKPSEFEAEHVAGAENTPLGTLNQHLNEFPDAKPFYLHCAGGYRSMIAGSMLKKRGIHNFINVNGGMKAIRETTTLLTEYQCASTL